MKTQRLILVLQLIGPASFAQSKPYVTPAKSGEMVLIVVATSKPEKKAPYESWMRDGLNAALHKTTIPCRNYP